MVILYFVENDFININRRENFITRYGIYVDIKHKCYSIVRKHTFYKGIPKDENGKKLVYYKKMSKKDFYDLVSILDK